MSVGAGYAANVDLVASAADGPLIDSNRALLVLFVAMVLVALLVLVVTIKIYERGRKR